jgi:hypothetical protein
LQIAATKKEVLRAIAGRPDILASTGGAVSNVVAEGMVWVMKASWRLADAGLFAGLKAALNLCRAVSLDGNPGCLRDVLCVWVCRSPCMHTTLVDTARCGDCLAAALVELQHPMVRGWTDAMSRCSVLQLLQDGNEAYNSLSHILVQLLNASSEHHCLVIGLTQAGVLAKLLSAVDALAAAGSRREANILRGIPVRTQQQLLGSGCCAHLGHESLPAAVLAEALLVQRARRQG